MTLQQFLDETENAALTVLECGDVIVYDCDADILYSTVDTHGRNLLSPLVDFRTMLGHHLLWSRQRELTCSNAELRYALDVRAGNE